MLYLFFEEKSKKLTKNGKLKEVKEFRGIGEALEYAEEKDYNCHVKVGMSSIVHNCIKTGMFTIKEVVDLGWRPPSSLKLKVPISNCN
jgi:hypothetical protein